MKITLPLISPAFDDNRLSEEVKKILTTGVKFTFIKMKIAGSKMKKLTHLLYGLNTEKDKENFNV